jgi:hypothetical protein
MAGSEKDRPPIGRNATASKEAVPVPVHKKERTVQFQWGEPSVSAQQETGFLSSLRDQLGSPGKIRALLATCTITPLQKNLSLDRERFLSGLVGATSFRIMDRPHKKTHTVFLAQTASSTFLIYKMPHESLYDIPGLTGAEFKNSFRLETQDGESLTMSYVFEREIKAIMSIRVDDGAGRRSQASMDTIAPRKDGDLVEFKFKLRSCKPVPNRETGAMPAIHMKTFADEVQFAAPFAEEGGRSGHYVIYFGPAESLFSLYVNSVPPEVGNRKVIAELQYNDDTCYLCRD